MPAITDHGGSGGSGRGGFPGLGFDPTPGNPEAVVTVLEAIQTASARLGEAAPRLAEAINVTQDWEGDAAEDFRKHGDDLPKGMTAGAEAMSTAGTALTAWINILTANQRQADALERAARELKKDLEQAEWEVRDAASRAAYAQGADKAPAEKAAADAEKKHTRIVEALRVVIDEAKRLRKGHLDAANAIAAAIEGAPDGAFAPVQVGGIGPVFDSLAEAVGSVADWGGRTAKAAATLDVNGLAENFDPIIPGDRNVAKAFALATLGRLGPLQTAAAGLGIQSAADTAKSVIGIGQLASGSPKSPRWWEVGIDVGLARVPIKGARGLVKGAVRGALEGGKKESLRQAGRLAGKRALDEAQGATPYKQVKEAVDLVNARRNADSLVEALENKRTKDLVDSGAKYIGGPDATPAELARRGISAEELRQAGERALIREYVAKAAEGILPGRVGDAAAFAVSPDSVGKAGDEIIDEAAGRNDDKG